MKAVNIDWDVDYEEDRSSLPTEVEIPKGMEDEEEISDYLSDVTGFCHKGFDLIESDKAINLTSVKKILAGTECECFEYIDPTNGPTGKMRLSLNGCFGDDIVRESLILVPLTLDEQELEEISDLWLTEQERELGLPLGVSCSSSSWWAGHKDSVYDADLTDKYDFLIPAKGSRSSLNDQIKSASSRSEESNSSASAKTKEQEPSL